jgi:hypothetical protein
MARLQRDSCGRRADMTRPLNSINRGDERICTDPRALQQLLRQRGRIGDRLVARVDHNIRVGGQESLEMSKIHDKAIELDCGTRVRQIKGKETSE